MELQEVLDAERLEEEDDVGQVGPLQCDSTEIMNFGSTFGAVLGGQFIQIS